MKRKIFLVRHGESADKQHSQTDFDRVLTVRGKHSVERLGKFFKEENMLVDLIKSSPSVRTKATSIILSNSIEYSIDKIEYEPLLYNGTDENYLNALKNSVGSLLIVGHNPALSFVIGKLTRNYSISLMAGQCAVLDFDESHINDIHVQSVQLFGPFH